MKTWINELPRELKSYFEQSFGFSISKLPLPGEELIAPSSDSLLYGSVRAKKNAFFVQSDIDRFIRSKRKGYFLMGFWGHGANSYAFYYTRIDEWSHIFFRLPYGGYYMENEKYAIQDREFLLNFFAIEPELRHRVKSMIAIESMDYGEYRFKLLDGKVVRLNESLLQNPDLRGKFSLVLSD